jgi:hypothetical protein
MAYKGTGVSAANAQSSAAGPGSTDSDAAAAASGSCVDAFDALWFCYSPAHQVAARSSTTFLAASSFTHAPPKAISQTVQFTQYYRTGLPDQCVST